MPPPGRVILRSSSVRVLHTDEGGCPPSAPPEFFFVDRGTTAAHSAAKFSMNAISSFLHITYLRVVTYTFNLRPNGIYGKRAPLGWAIHGPLAIYETAGLIFKNSNGVR